MPRQCRTVAPPLPAKTPVPPSGDPPSRQTLGEPRDAALDGAVLPQRHRQLLDETRRDVPSHQQTTQRVDDIRVQDAAEKLLLLLRQRGAQAEHGVRGDDVGWEDGGDERESIGDSRDVAVAEAGKAEPLVRQKIACDARWHSRGTGASVDGERTEVLALNHRQPDLAESAPIFRRIELTAEPKAPSVRCTCRRVRRGQPFEQLQVGRCDGRPESRRPGPPMAVSN